MVHKPDWNSTGRNSKIISQTKSEEQSINIKGLLEHSRPPIKFEINRHLKSYKSNTIIDTLIIGRLADAKLIS